jgi:SAM-dependent methyltransferase
MEMEMEWGGKETPTFFNHYHDLYYHWGSQQNYFWLERGIFNAFFIRPGANVLELCCGDGFNTKYFYSNRPDHVLALDIDETAISHARQFNHNPGIEYKVHDISKGLPGGKYNNVIIDAAIEQLTKDDQHLLLANIKKALVDDGIFSGLTVQRHQNTNYLEHNKNEFASSDDLRSFLATQFRFVKILRNAHGEKVHLYFVGSDKEIDIFD